MSTQAQYYRGHAFVAAELSSKPGALTDEETEAKAAGAIAAAVGYLQSHLGDDAARRAIDWALMSLPFQLTLPSRGGGS